MVKNLGIVQVPANLEALRKAVGTERLGQVLIECEPDLRALKQAIAEITSAGQSKLLFLLGRPGQGKTSLVESTATFLADVVGFVLTPPPDFELPLGGLPAWLSKQLPVAREKAGDRFVVINLDGREIPTTNEVETKAAMGNLNAFLRNQTNLLAVWPVNDEAFATTAIDRLTLAGGKSALMTQPIHRLVGLSADRYLAALKLVLAAMSVSLADAAVSDEEVSALVAPSKTVGDFLRAVQSLVVSRYDLGELGAKLPKIYIIVTSNDDTYDACRLLRRGSEFLVDPDKLLQFSRANVAEDWRRRGRENPRKGLPFIASLFEVRLLNVSSSAVVNACAFGGDADLPGLVRKHYNAKVATNAANSIRNSSLARALRGEDDVGLAKSNPTDPIRKAYRDIQKLTNPKHRAINESIVKAVQKCEVDLGKPDYEHLAFPGDSDRELRCDVWIERGDRPESLEFTHRADGDASVAVISSYVLGKIHDYARDFNLV
ncbi:MAG: hypothetical protein H6835_15575 [Planctomycetes bacterium]|nr:hypothetical protein [Planctomycetota bacterium]